MVRLQATPEAAGEIVNVGSTEETTILALAHLVMEVLSSASSIELVPYDQAWEGGFDDFPKRKPDIEKLERLTGFRPQVGLLAAVRRTAGLE